MRRKFACYRVDVARQCAWVLDRRIARHFVRRLGGQFTVVRHRRRLVYRYTLPKAISEVCLAI